MTVGQARRDAWQILVGHSDAPQLDADWLLLHVLDTSDASVLATEAAGEFTEAQSVELKRLVDQRLSGVPLAYIIGEAHFFGRVFTVTPEVLIPRPETEELVRQAQVAIQELQTKLGRPVVVADIGTGSGCVAITLLLECPGSISQMIASDISPAALAVAQKNAERHRVHQQIRFLRGYLLEPLAGIPVDLLVSNPPYVPSAELDQPPTIETAGLRFEPRQALDGGEDGLLYVKALQASGIPAVIETLQGEIITSRI